MCVCAVRFGSGLVTPAHLFGFCPFDVSPNALKPRPPRAGLVRGGRSFEPRRETEHRCYLFLELGL